jgi:hypothetical protein
MPKKMQFVITEVISYIQYADLTAEIITNCFLIFIVFLFLFLTSPLSEIISY